MSTFRAYDKDYDRVATAVKLKNGRILQVFPDKKEYDPLKSWHAEWPDTKIDETNRSIPSREPPAYCIRPAYCLKRVEKEFAEFLDVDYKWLVDNVKRVNQYTLEIELQKGFGVKSCRVYRSTNFMNPPHILLDGREPVCKYDYTPALSSVRLLLMLMFVSPG